LAGGDYREIDSKTKDKTPMYVKTGKPEFDNLIPLVKGFLGKDILDVVIDGQKIRGYRSPDSKAIWIRDYSDMIRAFRYFEKDLQSTIRHFADTQSRNGRVFDYFTTFPEKLPCEKENWTKYVRVPVEADVEYRLIKAAWISWQATGDDKFIKELLPCFGKALSYIMNSWYWDKEKFLVKRPYTIDTWDFAYTAGRHDWLQFQIDDHTFWGYMHGDNSGYYEAFTIMSRWYSYFGDNKRAEEWRLKADRIKKSLNDVCWNGDYYTHFVKSTPVNIAGVDESYQLSLSNPMNINRGVTTGEMAISILKEYQKRKNESGSFAEWFSIHPPFPDGIFGDEKLVAGAYCNGGIMPLVGGELAKAAFETGFEKYGANILKKYYDLISQKGESYLWYFPDGTHSSVETSTSPDATPTDGWGSGAMLYAFTEGLVGVQDKLKEFKSIRFTPRWEAAGVKDAEALIEYPASGAYIKYKYLSSYKSLKLEIEGTPENIDLELYLPENKKPVSVNVTGGDIKSINEYKNEGKYFKCSIKKNRSPVELIIKLSRK
jgi:hypothetical protein